jgi:hypothetical protein
MKIRRLADVFIITFIVFGIIGIGESALAQAPENLLPQLKFQNSGTVTRNISAISINLTII